MFVTRRGYIGLCPSSGKVGDVVAVLLGGSTPFILSAMSKGERRLGEGDSEIQGQNAFVLIGDCMFMVRWMAKLYEAKVLMMLWV